MTGTPRARSSRARTGTTNTDPGTGLVVRTVVVNARMRRAGWRTSLRVSPSARASAPLGQVAGAMFWLPWKMLSGSNSPLMA